MTVTPEEPQSPGTNLLKSVFRHSICFSWAFGPVLRARVRRHYHPDHPYQDPRVVPHLDDGRHFLHTTDRKYDLVVCALVDSMILHSSYANIRLESYLSTEQAFADDPALIEINVHDEYAVWLENTVHACDRPQPALSGNPQDIFPGRFQGDHCLRQLAAR